MISSKKRNYKLKLGNGEKRSVQKKNKKRNPYARQLRLFRQSIIKSKKRYNKKSNYNLVQESSLSNE